jgi:predicted nucleic acid-binding protein
VADIVIAGGRPEIPDYAPPLYVENLQGAWAQLPEHRMPWSSIISNLEILMMEQDNWEAQTKDVRAKLLAIRIAEIEEEKRIEAERIAEEKRRAEEAAALAREQEEQEAVS